MRTAVEFLALFVDGVDGEYVVEDDVGGVRRHCGRRGRGGEQIINRAGPSEESALNERPVRLFPSVLFWKVCRWFALVRGKRSQRGKVDTDDDVKHRVENDVGSEG